MGDDTNQLRMDMLDELRANVYTQDDFRELGERSGFGMASAEIMIRTDTARLPSLLKLYEVYKEWKKEKEMEEMPKGYDSLPPDIQELCNTMQEHFKVHASDYYEIAQLTGFTTEQVVAIVKGETGEKVDVLELYEAFKRLVNGQTTNIVEDLKNSKNI